MARTFTDDRDEALGLVGQSSMTITGMLRIKNEARWISQVIEAALKVCERVYVLDDHSTDNTANICRSFGERMRLYSSMFTDLNESRDKNWLLDTIRRAGADWILAIDGDELLMDAAKVREAAESGISDCYSLRVLYLWDKPNQIRTDGVYGKFSRPSLFRLWEGRTFRATGNGPNFHCGNVPQPPHGPQQGSARCEARLLHFGYMEQADRKRKFDWYNQHDPNNHVEDNYRHMIQGDPGGPSAHATLRHAGPLQLSAL